MTWQKMTHDPGYSLDIAFGSIEVWEGNGGWLIIASAGLARLRERGFPTAESAQARAVAWYADVLRAELARVEEGE